MDSLVLLGDLFYTIKEESEESTTGGDTSDENKGSSDENKKGFLKPRGPLKSGDYELSVDFELNVREEKRKITHKDLHLTHLDLKSMLGVKKYTIEDKIAVTMRDRVENARGAVINRELIEKKKYNSNEIR